MNYNEILKELDAVNLKNKFTADFEQIISKNFLKRIKKTNKIHSTGSLLRELISNLENNSKKWDYWVLVLNYFMTPVFARDLNKLPI